MLEMEQVLQGFRECYFLWKCNRQNVTLSLSLSSFLKSCEWHHGMLINIMLFKCFSEACPEIDYERDEKRQVL